MTEQTWAAVDHYLEQCLLGGDQTLRTALSAALTASAAAGLPAIQVSPTQGKLLRLLVRLSGARSVLEVGTLGGYSTIWLASALPAGGRLLTLEAEPHHADVARSNLERAGFGGVVEVRTGRALDSLPRVAEEGWAPFDFVFIDADKPGNADYVGWALRLSRPGTVIVVDNVVRDGTVLDADSDDPTVQGTRRLFDFLAGEPRLDATAIQTVGTKGYDGFALARVVAPS